MEQVDVVGAGSGAAGLTAALTAAHLGLSVLVIEKAGHFGGSTARSGGGIWAPGNTVLRDARVADTPGQARAYLAYVAEGVPAGRREALLEHGPDMLSLVLAMRFAWVPGYADYYLEAPGAWPPGAVSSPFRSTDGGCSARNWPISPGPTCPRRWPSRRPSTAG
jgi:3-oxosteroid 1-dehydrogenase